MSLEGGGGEHLFDQIRIPGAAQTHRLWKARRLGRHETMQRLGKDQGRDSQSRLFDQVALEAVDGLRVPADRWICQEVPRAESADSILEHIRISSGSEISVLVEGVGVPGTIGRQLSHFLLKCHPREEVGHTFVDRHGRISVFRRSLGHQ